MPMKLVVGDTVRLKKQHPCGGFEWQITRIGADIGLRCLTCGRRVLLARSKVEKRIKAILPMAAGASNRPTDARGGGAF
jgi:hypothetical protein